MLLAGITVPLTASRHTGLDPVSSKWLKSLDFVVRHIGSAKNAVWNDGSCYDFHVSQISIFQPTLCSSVGWVSDSVTRHILLRVFREISGLKTKMALHKNTVVLNAYHSIVICMLLIPSNQVMLWGMREGRADWHSWVAAIHDWNQFLAGDPIWHDPGRYLRVDRSLACWRRAFGWTAQ